MAKTIEIKAPQEAGRVTVELNDGTTLKVRKPHRFGKPSSWAAQRPGWGAASSQCNEVIAGCVEPELCAHAVGCLDPSERRRLLLAIVRLMDGEKQWRALYGTTLTGDERFLAVARWRREEEWTEILRGIREAHQRLISNTAASLGAEKLATGGGAYPSEGLMGLSRRVDQLAEPLDISAMAARIARPMMMEMNLLGGRAFDVPKDVFGISSAVSNTALNAGFDPTLSSSIRKMTTLELDRRATLLPSVGGIAQFAEPPGRRLSERAAQAGLFGLSKGSAVDFTRALGFATGLEVGVLKGRVFPNGLGVTSVLGGQPFAASVFPNALGIAALMQSQSRGFATLRPGFLSGISESVGATLGNHDLLPYIKGFHLDLVGILKRSPAGVIVIEFQRLWRGDPRWFLLQLLSPVQIPQLTEKHEAVVEAVLGGLEGLVREGALIESLRESLLKLPFIDRFQLEAFEHGLKEAAQGNWTPAVLCLISPFEGAIHARSSEAELIDDSARGKLMAAERVIKESELPEDLEKFAIQVVWGGQGNPFRHGRPQGSPRVQTLWLLVGLIGWIDFVSDTKGMQRLADQLHDPVRLALRSAGQPMEQAV